MFRRKPVLITREKIEDRARRLTDATTAIEQSAYLDDDEKESLKTNVKRRILDHYARYIEWLDRD